MAKIPKITLTQKPTYIKCAQDIDIVSLFDVIQEYSDTCFLLESMGEDGLTARYCVIGFDPLHIIKGVGNTLCVDGNSFVIDNPYNALQAMLPPPVFARKYAGGLVGYLSYDAVNYFEQSLNIRNHPFFPQFCFGVYTDGLVLDSATSEVFYFYYEKNRIKTVEAFLRKTPQYRPIAVQFQKDAITRQEHGARVAHVKEEIAKGNIFQCEVGFQSRYQITGDTRHIYRRLREVNPSPFMYTVKFGKEKIIGASPELLFRLRDGEMETFPLAGTIRRGNTPEEDRQLARVLLNDPKERAEHTMLVDLHRNDLGKVARFGTVKVRNLMNMKRFSHVQHIESEVVGILRRGETMFSALAANFPAGTLTGAPKIEAMKIINRIEDEGRGPYGGALGHFGFNGDCTFAIPIRTLFLHDIQGYTQTCGGIVADSEADKEYDEIMRKSQAMREVLSIES